MNRSHGEYEVETITPLVVVDTVLRNDGLAMMLLNLMQGYALQNDLMDETAVLAWADEQRHLAADGRFFFSLVHFVTSGRRYALEEQSVRHSARGFEAL